VIKDISNFGVRLLEFFTYNGMTKIASVMLGAGVFLIIGGTSFVFTFVNDDSFFVFDGTQDSGIIALLVGLILTLIAVSMLLQQYKLLSSKKVVLYYGNTLKFGGKEEPRYAVLKQDKLTLDIQSLNTNIDSYDKKQVLKDYDYNHMTFENRTFHNGLPKVYVASLGSFPYLYLMGTLIRNGYIESIVLDYDRDKGKWYRLDYFGEIANNILADSSSMSIEEKLTELCSSDSKDIGIALGYTFEIDKNSMPDKLRENTLYLKSSLGYGRDKLNRMQTQISLLDEIMLYIDRLKNANKDMHLFVSAQASFCVNLGKRYQDNIMGKIYLHNFVQTNEGRERDWYITFNRGDVS